MCIRDSTNVVWEHPCSRESIDKIERVTLEAIRYRKQNAVRRDDYLQMLIDMQNTHVDPEFSVDGKENAKNKSKPIFVPLKIT